MKRARRVKKNTRTSVLVLLALAVVLASSVTLGLQEEKQTPQPRIVVAAHQEFLQKLRGQPVQKGVMNLTLTEYDEIIQEPAEVGRPLRFIAVKRGLLGVTSQAQVYEYPPPRKIEKRHGKKKIIRVWDNLPPGLHAYNITATTDVTGYKKPVLYRVHGQEWIPVENYQVLDTDSDGKNDTLRWTIPHLSEVYYIVGEGAGTGSETITIERTTLSRVGYGKNVTITLTVYNKGDKTAYNLNLTDTITGTGWTIVNPGDGTLNGNTITFHAGTLYPDQAKTFYYVINAPSSDSTVLLEYNATWNNETGDQKNITTLEAWTIATENPKRGGVPEAHLEPVSPPVIQGQEEEYNLTIKNIGVNNITSGTTIRVILPLYWTAINTNGWTLYDTILPMNESTGDLSTGTINTIAINDSVVLLFYDGFEAGYSMRNGTSNCDNTVDYCEAGYGNFDACDDNNNDYVFCSDDDGISDTGNTRSLRMIDWDTWDGTKGLMKTIDTSGFTDVELNFWSVANSLDNNNEYCEVTANDSATNTISVYRLNNGDACEIGTANPTPADWPSACHQRINLSTVSGLSLGGKITLHLGADESGRVDYCHYDEFTVIGYRPLTREQNSSWAYYNDTGTSRDLDYISAINISVTVTGYDPTASDALGNNPPRLMVGMFDGTKYRDEWPIDLSSFYGNTQSSQSHTFTITVSDQNIIDAWTNRQENRKLRIRAEMLDYYGDTTIDGVNWSTVNITYVRDEEYHKNELVWTLTSDIPPGGVAWNNFTAIASRSGGYGVTIRVRQNLPKKILIVDDQGGSNGGDGSSAGHFSAILSNAVYDITYCTLPANQDYACSEGMTLSASYLQGFDAVVWSTGDYYGDTIGNGVGSGAESMLISYVSNGGRLILEGGDIGYDRGSGNTFMSSVAHADYSADLSATQTLRKVPGQEDHPVIRDMPLEQDITGGSGSEYPDRVNPTNNGYALASWLSGGYGLIAYDGITGGNNDNARTVYMAFSIDGITQDNNDPTLSSLVVNSVEWVANVTYKDQDYTQEFVRVYGGDSVQIIHEVPVTMKSNQTIQVNITVTNNGNDTVILGNLTENITNQECAHPTQKRFLATGITTGLFRTASYNQTLNLITWEGIELQPGESVTVSYNLTSPICFSETLFQNATIARFEWNNQTSSVARSISDARNITVREYNRGHITFDIQPVEASNNTETRFALVLESDGERNVTSIKKVNITLPSHYQVDEASISNGGTYNATTRTITWTDPFGLIPTGSSELLYFNATPTRTGTEAMPATAEYTDPVGSRTSSNNVVVETLQPAIKLSYSPEIVKPGGTTTLTVTIPNPYSGTMTGVTVVPQLPQGWSASPSSQYIDAIPPGESANPQFLVTVTQETGTYNTNATITYTDPNNEHPSYTAQKTVEVDSRPEMVVFREVPEREGTGDTVTVRLFLYNKGNDIAYNTTLVERIEPSLITDGGSVTGYTGTWNPTEYSITWHLGDIEPARFVNVSYNITVSTVQTTYWLNATATYQDVNNNEKSATNNGTTTVWNRAGIEFSIDTNTTAIGVQRLAKTGQETTITFTVKNVGDTGIRPRILVVDDQGGSNGGDGSSAGHFQTTLQNLGYEVVYCTLPANQDYACSEGMTLSASYLQGFDAVVWSTGDYYGDTIGNGVGSGAESMLISYVSNGGRLILEGGDIGYDRRNTDPNNFMGLAAHADNVGDIPLTGTTTTSKHQGMENHPVIFNLPDPMTICNAEFCTGTANYGSRWPDQATTDNKGYALYDWDAYSGYSLIAYDGVGTGNNDNAKTLYMAFSIDGLSQANMQTLVRDGTAWLINDTVRVAIIVPPSWNVTGGDYSYTETTPEGTMLVWNGIQNTSLATGQEMTFTFTAIPSTQDMYTLRVWYNSSDPNGKIHASYKEGLFAASLAGTANVTITSPENNAIVHQGDTFQVNASVLADGGNLKSTNSRIVMSGALSLPDNDPSHYLGDILEGTTVNTTWKVTALVLGDTDIAVVATPLAGNQGQDKINITIARAVNITNIQPSQRELEPGDVLDNITVTTNNTAKSTHDINTTVSIRDQSGIPVSWGPQGESHTVTGVAGGTLATTVFDNTSQGYLVPPDAPPGVYTIRAVSRPDDLDPDTKTNTLRIVNTTIESHANQSTLDPGETILYWVYISNNWSSSVEYNVTSIKIYNATMSDKTQYWTIVPEQDTNKTIPGGSSDTLSFILMPSSNNTESLAGDYHIEATIEYVDPNGRQKTRNTTITLTINQKPSFSLSVLPPLHLPLGLDSIVNVTIKNTGNILLENVNITLEIRDLAGRLMDWVVTPLYHIVNLAAGITKIVSFTVSVPGNASTGEYNLTATGVGVVSNTTSTLVNVTRDIAINKIETPHKEYEPGDVIDWINVTLENTAPDVNYTGVNTSVAILDANGNIQDWGPLPRENKTTKLDALEKANLSWNNNTNGYKIDPLAPTGVYTINATATWDGGVQAINTTTITIVRVNQTLSTNTSILAVGESVDLDITIYNGFSSQITAVPHVEVWKNGENMTQYWSINPQDQGLIVPGDGNTTITVTLTSPSRAIDAPAGDYELRVTTRYTDPNGREKTMTGNSLVTVLEYYNATIQVFAEDMPKGVDSTVIVRITNTGNAPIEANTTLSIYNSTGIEQSWAITPAIATRTIPYDTFVDVAFTVSTPQNAPVGEYTANATTNYTGGNTITAGDGFNVTQDISISVSHKPVQIEPGDVLENITANITNVNQAEEYNTTSHVEIYNATGDRQYWGPPEADTRTQTGIKPGETRTIYWDNNTNGYNTPVDIAPGNYTIRVVASVEPIGATRRGEARTLEVVRVQATTTTNTTTVGIGTPITYNITIYNGFSQPIDFDIGSVTITNQSGENVTSDWTIQKITRTLHVNGKTTNTTTILLVTPSDPTLARPGTYNITILLGYVDPNGRQKTRNTPVSTIEIVPVERINISITPPSIAPPGLDSPFQITLENTGNTPLDNVNVTLSVDGEEWASTPSWALVSVPLGGTNTTTINITVPASALEGDYNATATATTQNNNRFQNKTNFTVENPIMVDEPIAVPWESEPGTTTTINVTVSNTHPDRAINVTVGLALVAPNGGTEDWSLSEKWYEIPPGGSHEYSFDASIPIDAPLGNHTITANATYGTGAARTNTSNTRVSTIVLTVTAEPQSIDWGENTSIRVGINNTWMTRSIQVQTIITRVTNTSGDQTALWSISPVTTTGSVGPLSIDQRVHNVSTTTAGRGAYNFTVRINYTDPNTGSQVSREHNVTVKLGLADVSGSVNLQRAYQDEQEIVVARVDNTGGYDLSNVNVTVWIEKATSRYYWFNQSSWTIQSLPVGATNTKTLSLYVPPGAAPGQYNATLNITYRDQDGLVQHKTIATPFNTSTGVDILVLVGGMDAPLVKPGENHTATILVEKENGQGVEGANLSIELITPDGSVAKINETTNTSGMASITLPATSRESAYYLNITATTPGDTEDENREAVILVEDNKSVLVVADKDAGTGSFTDEQEYLDALSRLGTINLTVDTWDTSTRGSPTLQDMEPYDAVVWTTGDYKLGLFTSQTEVDAITAYLSLGRGLVLEGESIAYDEYYGYARPGLFHALGVELPSSDPMITTLYDDPVNTSIAYYWHPLVEGPGGMADREYTVKDSGSLYKDKTTPNTTSGGSCLQEWKNLGYCAGVVREDRTTPSGGYNTLYLPFSVRGLEPGQRNKTIVNHVLWAIQKHAALVVSRDMDIFPSGGNATGRITLMDYAGRRLEGVVLDRDLNVTVQGPTGSVPVQIEEYGRDWKYSFQAIDPGKYYLNATFNRTGYYYTQTPIVVVVGYQLNITTSNDTGPALGETRIYDENGTLVYSTVFVGETSKPLYANKNYTIEIEIKGNETSRIVLHDYNLTTNIEIPARMIENYTGWLPSGTYAVTPLVGLNDTGMQYSYANLLIPKGNLSEENITEIYHCLSWDYVASNCTQWETLDPSTIDFWENDTHFSINVTGFDFWGGGARKPLPNVTNITIYDVTGLADTHSGGRYIGSGLNATFNLYQRTPRLYRIQYHLSNDGRFRWDLDSGDDVHMEMPSSWIVDPQVDAWYNIAGTNYTGGTYTNGVLRWNTSLGESVARGDTIDFFVVVNITDDQTLARRIYFIANDTDTNSGSNDTSTINITRVGYLNMSLDYPPLSGIVVGYNKTFWLNATVTCLDGDVCGSVNMTPRYNSTSQVDTVMGTTWARPMYVAQGQVPYSCHSPLKTGESCTASWLVNATSTPVDYRLVDSNASSSIYTVQENDTMDALVEINIVLILVLGFDTIDFGNIDPSQELAYYPALMNSQGGYNISIDDASNEPDGLYVAGENLTGQTDLAREGNYHIWVGDIYWDDQSTGATRKPLSYEYQLVAPGIRNGENITTYYWLRNQTGLGYGLYNGTITFMINKTL